MVERLIADSWTGVRCIEHVTAEPSVNDFVSAFNKLNAHDRTLLMLEGKNGRQMGIGGGHGRYIVYCAFSESEFWNLISDPTAHDRVILNAGGQEGDYPLRQVVNRDRAQKAGVEFMMRGELDASLHWELQE